MAVSSISFGLRAYAPCGPSVRVASPTKSRKPPTRTILPLFFVSTSGSSPCWRRLNTVVAVDVATSKSITIVVNPTSAPTVYLAKTLQRPIYLSTVQFTFNFNGGQFDFVWFAAHDARRTPHVGTRHVWVR